MPYGKEPTMGEVWARLWWDVVNIANNEVNPFAAAGEGGMKPKRRTAREDIGHALENVFVEGWRKLKARFA